MEESGQPVVPPPVVPPPVVAAPVVEVPWWRAALAQYAVPTAFASLVAAAVSVFTALGAAHDKQREYNTKFESLVTAPEIRTAFGGTYVDPKAVTYEHDRGKAYFDQSVKEQQATAMLISLQSVAESEIQRRTVLLIGARLLNADPNYTGTGGPAARLLTILIDQADVGRDSWNPSERHLNEHLWDTINSQSFKDLVTAGYSSDYYNDDFSNLAMKPYSPTLNGDAPVTSDTKFQVLWKLTKPDYDGWVHLATYGYKFPRGEAPHPAAGARHGSQPAVTPQTAASFVTEVTDVTLRRNMTYVGAITAQYAITDPRDTPPHDPLFDVPQLVGKDYPRTLVMLKHRLLRSRPPVQYINPDGQFRKGSLGKITGVVPAGSCIDVREPMQAVLVFLPSEVVPPKVKTNTALTGLVHMWAHVRGSKKTDEDCLSVVAGVK